MDAETAARVICAYLKRAYEAAGLRWNYMTENEVKHALLVLANPPEPEPEPETAEPEPAAIAGLA